MSTLRRSTVHPGSRAMRLLCFLVALTAGLSLLYATQYYLGSPLRLAVTSEIHDLALSPTHHLVAAAAQDGMIRLWDMDADWKMYTLTSHTGPVTSVAFDASGSTLFSAGNDGKVYIWDITTILQAGPSNAQPAQVFAASNSPLQDLSLTPDGSMLATLGDDHIIRVWDIETGEVIQAIGPSEHSRRAVALSPDGTLVAAGDANHIQMWDAHSGEPRLRLEGQWEDEEDQEDWLGHEKEVTALAFSPDGAYLASGSAEGTTLIWDVEQGQLAWETKGHLGAVSEVAFDASGEHLLSSGGDNMVRRWKIPGGKFAGLFTGHLGTVSGVAAGPDENTILSSGVDGSVRLWEVVNNQELHLVWTKLGLMPIWGKVLVIWMLGSGLLGLLLAWGLWRVRTWSYLGALSMYTIGPLFAVVLPMLETIAYPITWSIRLHIAWPLACLFVWYYFLVLYLRNDAIAIPYQAPDAESLAQRLMAAQQTRNLRQGLFVLATWLLIFILLFSVLRRFGLDIAFMRKWLPFIMGGAGLTMFVSAMAILLATVLALVGALGRLAKNPVINGISGFYVSLIRGTPLLVQIFIWFLALPQIGITLKPVTAGILALGVNYGAYMTEIFRAGIQAIGIGQYEAAHALGMSSSQTFRRIVLPQAFRIVIPPIGNEFIAMMKDSALVSMITVQELTFRAQKLGRQNFRNLETFLIAAAFYWILTIVFQFFQSKLETYMARGERR